MDDDFDTLCEDDDPEEGLDVDIEIVDDHTLRVHIARALRYELPRHGDSSDAIEAALRNLEANPHHYDDLEPSRASAAGPNLGLAFAAVLLGMASYILYQKLSQGGASDGGE